MCQHHHHHRQYHSSSRRRSMEETYDNRSTVDGVPQEEDACDLGSRDAEAAAAKANFVTYGISMIANPLIGSYSDSHGRRPTILFSLGFSCIPALMFCGLVRMPSLSPVWYYASTTMLGWVNYISIAYAALADCIPKEYRTSAYGILMAAYFGGFFIAPTVAILVTDPRSLSALALSWIVLALVLACFVLPETVSSSIDDAPNDNIIVDDTMGVVRRITPVHNDSLSITTDLNWGLDEEEEEDNVNDERINEDEYDAMITENNHILLEPQWTCRTASIAILHQVRASVMNYWDHVSILTSTTILQLLALASFLSTMVFSTDATLFVYYVENNFALNPRDIASLFMVLGVAGIVVQAGLLSFLLEMFGERNLLVISFVSGTFHNILYCTARSKGMLYLAFVVSQLTKTNFPILSSLAGSQVSEYDQGQLQGVLSAVNALAMAIGPPIFMKLSSTPSQVFGYAAVVYGIGVVLVLLVAVTLQTNIQNQTNTENTNIVIRNDRIDTESVLEQALLDESQLESVE